MACSHDKGKDRTCKICGHSVGDPVEGHPILDPPHPFLPRRTQTRDAGEIFAARASELATWTMERMVNRTDVWGGYNPLGAEDYITTRPAKKLRGDRILTHGDLRRHYGLARLQEPHQRELIVGLHTTSPENTSLWGAIEIDWHLEGDGTAHTWPAVQAWYNRLAGLGFVPLLTDSNGKGGFHLRALFSSPADTELVFNFLQWLVRDWKELGLPKAPEIFPKQPRLDATKPFGNWLRLPGKHHSREHWSPAWDGQQWLAGGAAIDFMLSLGGDRVDLIPVVDVQAFAAEQNMARGEPSAAPNAGGQQDRPASDGKASGGTCDLPERIRRYVDTLDPSVQGQYGSRPFWKASCTLVIGFDLSPAAAKPFLQYYNATKCLPAWSDVEMEHALARANALPGRRGKLLEDRPFDKAYRPPWDDEIAGVRHLRLIGNFDLVCEFAEPSAASSIIPQQRPAATGGDGASLISLTSLPLVNQARHKDYSSYAEFLDATNPAMTQLAAELASNKALRERMEAEKEREQAAKLDAYYQQRLCPNMMTVIQERDDFTGGRTLQVCCHRPDCPFCRGATIRKWKLNFDIRLSNPEVPYQLWRNQWTVEEFAVISRRVRRAGGKYAFCPYTGDVVTTVPVTNTAGQESEGITKPEAIRFLADLADAVPHDWHTRKMFCTSRGWAWLHAKDDSGGYHTFGRGPSGRNAVETVRSIIRECRIAQTQDKQPKSEWSGYLFAIEFRYPKGWGNARKAWLINSLCRGHVLEEPSFQEEAEAAEWEQRQAEAWDAGGVFEMSTGGP